MKNIIISFIAIAFLAGFSSCVKDKLDSPPTGGTDPNIAVNYSIRDLKSQYLGAGFEITEDHVISAVVVGDDKSGNLYKQLAIEDSTAGIMLMISSSGLYNIYPIGTRLFIKLKGLYVGQKKGLMQLGAFLNADGSVGGLLSSNTSNFIFPGKWGINVAPIITTIANVNAHYNDLQSELIELDNVEFASTDRNVPYATGYGLTLEDCNTNFITVYTAPGYATFSNSPSPSGNGKFICLVGVYNGPQLTIRDTTDLFLKGPNCAAQSGLTIAQLRAEYTGSPVVLAAGTAISGVVISDYTNGNAATNTMYIEDATGGMQIRFTSAHSFPLNSNLTISLAGDSLMSSNGGLVVTSVSVGNAAPNGGTLSPTIHTGTVAQINASAAAWESTLVQVSGATISGGSGSNYNGSHTVNDGTGSATLYTNAAATFSGVPFPTSAVTITAILEQNSGVQLAIRNTGDVH